MILVAASNLTLMTPKRLVLLLTLALHSSLAQSEISFEWVTVGDPGNPNDPLTGVPTSVQTPVRGAVPYVYSISKYEPLLANTPPFLMPWLSQIRRGTYRSMMRAWATGTQ